MPGFPPQGAMQSLHGDHSGHFSQFWMVQFNVFLPKHLLQGKQLYNIYCECMIAHAFASRETINYTIFTASSVLSIHLFQSEQNLQYLYGVESRICIFFKGDKYTLFIVSKELTMYWLQGRQLYNIYVCL